MSKWDKIERCLFIVINQDWRREPLVSYQVVVNLIAAASAARGLKVRTEIDDSAWPAGTMGDDQEMPWVRLKGDPLPCDWNYEILPHTARWDLSFPGATGDPLPSHV